MRNLSEGLKGSNVALNYRVITARFWTKDTKREQDF
jgi:hypothetical protein